MVSADWCQYTSVSRTGLVSAGQQNGASRTADWCQQHGRIFVFLHPAKFKIDLAIALSGAKHHFLLSIREQGGGRGLGATPPENFYELGISESQEKQSEGAEMTNHTNHFIISKRVKFEIKIL